MATATTKASTREPTWDMVDLFPRQGEWTEDDYLELEATIGNRMIELVDGRLEILPMPTPRHQRIVKFLLRRVDDFVAPEDLGEVMMAPMPVRVLPGRIREPDLMFFEARRVIDPDERPLHGPDLAMEVPSPGKKNRKRDLVTKRREYARAKIREYWIVDPEERTITVLILSGKSYKVHGLFNEGENASSKLLKGFSIAVSDVFAAGERK